MAQSQASSEGKQHYVPRFYLQNFAFPTEGKRKRRRIYVRDRVEHRTYPAPIRDTASDFGFYDAVDATTGQVAYKYLALDQSMLFLALVNHLTDHAVQRRFASDPILVRALPVIAPERFFK